MSSCLADMSISELKREALRTIGYRQSGDCTMANRHADACEAIILLTPKAVGKGSASVEQELAQFRQQADAARLWVRSQSAGAIHQISTDEVVF